MFACCFDMWSQISSQITSQFETFISAPSYQPLQVGIIQKTPSLMTLPEELITMIFGSLNLRETYRLRSTCKKFQKIPPEQYLYPHMIQEMVGYKAGFTGAPQQVKAALNKIGELVKELDLSGMSLRPKYKFDWALKICPNLESLILKESNFEYDHIEKIALLPHLSKLIFKPRLYEDIADELFLDKVFKNKEIKKLKIQDCELLLKNIEENTSSQLEELDLTCNHVDSIDDTDLPNMLSKLGNCSFIKKLCLRSNINLSEFLRAVVQQLPQLECLTLFLNGNCSEEATALLDASSLQILTINDMSLSSEGVQSLAILANSLPKLKQIEVTLDLIEVGDQKHCNDMSHALEQLSLIPQLKAVSLVTAQLENPFEQPKDLDRLLFRYALEKLSPKISSIQCDNMGYFTQELIQSLTSKQIIIPCLKLSITGNLFEVTQKLIDCFPHVQELELKKAIIKNPINAPNLTKFVISESQLTQVFLEAFSKNLPSKLRSFSLINPVRFTNEPYLDFSPGHLDGIIENGTFSELNLSRSCYIDDETISSIIAHQSGTLCTLNIESTYVSKDGVRKAKELLPSLKQFTHENVVHEADLIPYYYD